MNKEEDEDSRLRSIALQTANSIMHARQRAEEELIQAKEALERKTNELAHSLAMVRATLDSTTDAILATDDSTKVTNRNHQYLAMWRIPPESQYEHNHRQLLKVVARQFSDPSQFLARVEDIYASSAPESYDLLELADGRVIERFSKTQFVDERNVGRVWTFRDITERRHAEEARLHLSSIVDSTDDAIVSNDLDGVIRSWNWGATRLFGYAAEEVIGKSFTLLLPADRLHEEEEILRRLQRGQRVDHFESVRVHKDGRLIDVSIAISPIRDVAGQIIGTSKITRDIAERKRAMEALEESRRFLRSILDALESNVAILDEFGTILEVNDAWRHFADQNQFAGSECGVGANYLLACEQCGDGLNAVKGIREVIAARSARFTTEYPCHSPSEMRWFEMHATRFQSPGPVRVVVAHHNVTERRLTEETLKTSERRLRVLTRAMPQLVWECAADGQCIFQAPQWEAVTGQSVADAFEYGWLEMVHPGDRLRAADDWKTAQTSRATYECEFRLHCKNGQYRWFLARGVPSMDDTGQIVSWVGTSTDIDDRKRAEEALKDADRHKDKFLATLAHELRNPLAPIRNSLELMRMAGDDWHAVELSRTIIDRQLMKMVRLVDDLLDVSRISQDKLQLRKERVELAAVINSAIETSRPLIEDMGHELTVTLPGQLITVEADPMRLGQAFLNLLNNAAKYSDRGGHIWLNTERQGSDVVVAVRDSGIGIPPDQLHCIFGLFSQVSSSLERSRGGLGIGLSLVKRLVEMHGGSIEAKSDGPGKGSEFVVRLPVVVEASRPQAEGRPEAAARKSSLRILVVDDNRDGADSLAMMLQMMGNETRTAYDGQEALSVAGKFRPDVVLLDIGLPKLNGYEACRCIREQPWGKDIVLIAQTGWAQEEDQRRSREVGFDHHMVKPVELDAFMTLLAELEPTTA